MAGDPIEHDIGGRMLAEQDGRGAHGEGEQEVRSGGVAEVELGDRHRDVVLPDPEDSFPVALRRVRVRGVGLEDRLRASRRAAGEEPYRGVVPVRPKAVAAIGRGGQRPLELGLAGDEQETEAGRPLGRAVERAGRLRFHDRRLRSGVAHEVGGRVVGEARVDHDHDRANLEDSEQGADELRTIVQREDHPLLGLDAGIREDPP
jgi:hypothetical protein